MGDKQFMQKILHISAFYKDIFGEFHRKTLPVESAIEMQST